MTTTFYANEDANAFCTACETGHAGWCADLAILAEAWAEDEAMDAMRGI